MLFFANLELLLTLLGLSIIHGKNMSMNSA